MLYTCPSCGAGMTYDADVHSLKCMSCGNTFEQAPASDRIDSPAASCANCGAPIENAEKKLTYHCEYCDSWMLLDTNITYQGLTPQKIVPPNSGRGRALEKIRTAFDNIAFMPDDFLYPEDDRCIKGEYVPFFLYDVEGEGRAVYECENTTSWDSGKTTYTKHDIYRVVREYRARYRDVPIDASDRINDRIIDRVAPFDRSDEREGLPKEILPGYEMSVFDKPPDSEEYYERSNAWTRDSSEDRILSSVRGYDSVNRVESGYSSRNTASTYAFFPVYEYNYVYGSKTGDPEKDRKRSYTIYVNGTNDRVSGRVPISWWKLNLHFIVEGVCTVVSVAAIAGILRMIL
ncbi:MAG: hypothetical protein IJT00_06805 [Lachnospiraceae bacterium]|nr:hypothetical protein [Lachnospiraceae bacterium]